MSDAADPSTEGQPGHHEPTVVIADNPQGRRWEIHVDGQLAGLLDYRPSDNRVLFPHTEIYPRYEDRGYATRLVTKALDAFIADGKKIVPECEFVADFVRRNPSYAEHVDASARD